MNHASDEDEEDTFLSHMQSPQQKPDLAPKVPALVPSGGQFSPGGLGGMSQLHCTPVLHSSLVILDEVQFDDSPDDLQPSIPRILCAKYVK